MMITEMLGKEPIFPFFQQMKGVCCRIPDLFGARWCYCPGERGREREREGEGTFPFFLNLPYSLSLPLSFRLYLYDILARRFISHLVISLLSPLGSPLALFSSSSCFFFFGLVKMMKKKIRFSMDQAPSTSFMAGEEARARFKYQCLLQDYLELLKEAEEKRERFKRAMQSKLKLLAEVKFLRKKYHSLSKTTQAFPCKVKKQSYKNVSPSKQVSPPHCPVIETELALKERNSKSKEISLRSAPRLIDLNQVSLSNGEEMDAFEMDWEPLKMDDDHKFSVCRDIGRSSSQAGKRKISWQDQLALRV